jgi:hypothetical protein
VREGLRSGRAGSTGSASSPKDIWVSFSSTLRAAPSPGRPCALPHESRESTQESGRPWR